MKNFQEIKVNGLTWMHLSNPQDNELEFLRQNYKFHPLDYQDLVSNNQYPKLDSYDHYLFMVLIYPLYLRSERKITSMEVDFFVGHNFIITVTNNNFSPLETFFEECRQNDTLREKNFSSGTTYLLQGIIHRLQNYCRPILRHLAEDIEKVESGIFTGQERKMVHEILLTKRNLNAFRKMMRSHELIIHKLTSNKDKFFIAANAHEQFNETLQESREIWETLEALRDAIHDLYTANESLISFRLNDVMRILTIFSAVLLPANLIAVIFGMKTEATPIIGWPNDFYFIICLMATVIFCLLYIFRKKGWL